MELRTKCKWMVIAGTLIIWTIKLLVRPYVQGHSAPVFFLGVAPNFLGAFLVPFAAHWLYTHPAFFNGRLLRFHFCSDVRIVCIFGFLLAVVNEYLQLIPIFGRTFDYYDLAFTVLGLLLAYAVFSLIRRPAEGYEY